MEYVSCRLSNYFICGPSASATRTPVLLQNTLAAGAAVGSDRSLHLRPDKITQELPVSPTLIPSQFHLWLPSPTAPSQSQIAPITLNGTVLIRKRRLPNSAARLISAALQSELNGEPVQKASSSVHMVVSE